MTTARATAIIDAADPGALDRAAAALAAGALVALPTETVYGLCALARRDDAVAAVYAAKGRPARNPLIVHGADAAAVAALGTLGPAALRLAEKFWPGPLTIVARRAPGAAVSPLASAGGDTVALRVPEAPFFRTVAARVGPIVAPSANRSGRVSATAATAVAEELGGRIALIVDGGPSPIGVESTVVEMVDTPRLLRPGALSREAIEAVIGPLAGVAGTDDGGAADDGRAALPSPGLLSSHYAPRARLRLDVPAADVRADEGWLALGNQPSAAAQAHTVRLSTTGDLDEAARALYCGLRMLDATGVAVIAVSPVPAHGIGAAIRDRLARAAAPRPEDTP
ncbi:MAG: L-threonylcarbamoyladenylate synthase [Acuticoccus sp.]